MNRGQSSAKPRKRRSSKKTGVRKLTPKRIKAQRRERAEEWPDLSDHPMFNRA